MDELLRRRFPTVGEQQRGINSIKKSSGLKSICNPNCGQAKTAPTMICISGSGIWKGKMRVTTPDNETVSNKINMVKNVSIVNLLWI
ncbi:hypothetical protein A4U88_4884 [Serratia marcescens]|nr:hypothetical protein A4U88_4884 [Serratia marcescens]